MSIKLQEKSKIINFIPRYRKIDNIDKNFSIEEIKNEPMLFQASYDFAKNNGGDITKEILYILRQDKGFRSDLIQNPNNLIIDTRVNMLTKGVYPSIPGWHCDDVPRKNRYKQPDFDKISGSICHYIVVISNEPNVSGTEFITSDHMLKLDSNDVWNSLNKKINYLKNIKTKKLKSGEILEFNQLAIHRATPAKKYGWRLFFRASFTYRKPENEIRKQTQVYYDINNAGW